MITLVQLQKEVGEWSRRNFPNNKPYHPLLGLFEEVGELEDALSSEPDKADVEDAIADATIYLADYCERGGMMMTDAVDAAPNTSAVYRMCHFHLKGEQGIRYPADAIPQLKQDQVQCVISYLKWLAEMNEVNFYEAVDRTWTKVKKRDWAANPIHAATIAERG